MQVPHPSEKFILALDGMNKSGVFSLLKQIPDVKWVKVGLELFVSEGPEIVSDLRDKDKKVFLDLKFHDIPSTVSKACFQAAKTGAELISVHSCVGTKSLKMAGEAVIEGSKIANLPVPTLLAITVLTSWEKRSFSQELLINESINSRVNHLARLAYLAGIGGCVCSPKEVESLRQLYPFPFELVTPGIRSIGSKVDDQARTMDAKMALRLGASKLVIGRSITKSLDPLMAFESLCLEVSSC